MNADTCICCGEIIPEGRQVCVKCENAAIKNKPCPKCEWWCKTTGSCDFRLINHRSRAKAEDGSCLSFLKKKRGKKLENISCR